MTQPIWVLRVGNAPETDLGAETLRCEGFPWLEERPVEEFDGVPPGVELLVVVGTGLSQAAAERLAAAVYGGTPLIALAPDPVLASAFGLTVGEAMADAHLSVATLARWEHGGLPLLCPDETARPLTGGERVAELRDGEGVLRGAGIARVRLGEGQAWLYGYDLCRVVATLRHGTGQLDVAPGGVIGWLGGPRHIYGFEQLSSKLPRDVPVADVHQDALRTLVQAALSASALPRLWHFPDAAPSLWFVKADGCGEAGAPEQVAFLEEHGAPFSFYSPPGTRYPGDLLREWHERGHGIAMEADINAITQPQTEGIPTPRQRAGRTVAELNARHLPEIRANLEQHRDTFQRATGIETDTVCIHSCQWTGEPMARMLLDLGWHTPTHFISHDPRMRRNDRYGPYLIATALPMRYFEHGRGLLDLWHMPAQWDESQTLGRHEDLLREPVSLPPETVEGMVGLTSEEYGVELVRFGQDAAARWHGVQITNFHPCYTALPPEHPRASRRALELGLRGARAAGCRFESLERWSRFFRARAAVRLVERRRDRGDEVVTLSSDQDIAGLTLLLPEGVSRAWNEAIGEELAPRELLLEGRRQRAVVVRLDAGVPVSLRMSTVY